MKLITILHAFMACSYAMHIPCTEIEEVLQKRADHPGTSTGKTIPDHYIVVLKRGQAESAYKELDEWFVKQFAELEKRDDFSEKVQFFNVLNVMGYTGYLPPSLLHTVKNDPLVDFVEEDQIFYTTKFSTQKKAPWNVARISQRANKKSQTYAYDDQAGKGVTAYVLDTGIKVQHPDFEGRARWGPAIPLPHVKVDGTGHGTHVAGTLGAKTYGVAKKVELVAVQVFDATGEGPTSDILKGIEYAVNDFQTQSKAKIKGYRGAIINLSLSGKPSAALDLALNNAMDGGLHVVVSAGNRNQDACNFSPGRATGPITVASTDINDVKATDSNFGSCVDVQAPGVDILSAGIHLVSAVMSGTSQATPHVSGIIATFMSLQPGVGSDFNVAPVKPVDLKRMFLRFSTRAVIKGLDKASPNKLAYNGAGLDLKDLWIL